MKQLPSKEFRKVYPRLTEAVDVTALGRVIGTYVPVNITEDDRALAGLRPGEPKVGGMSQAERDRILRRVNRRENP